MFTCGPAFWLSPEGSAAPSFNIFYGFEEAPSGTVTGDPVTARSAFMARLTGASSESFESFTVNSSGTDAVSVSQNGSTCTIKTTVYIDDGDACPTAFNFDPWIQSRIDQGRFNTTPSGEKYLQGIVNGGTEFGPLCAESIDAAVLSFQFSSAIAAFGFYGIDFTDFAEEGIYAALTDSFDVRTEHAIRLSVSSTGNLLFWGFVDTTGTTYTKVEIFSPRNSLDLTDDAIGIDDLVFCTSSYLVT